MDELPHYVHTVEIWLERDSELQDPQRLDLLLTGLYQWRRVGVIQRIDKGPALGQMLLQFDVEMTCPPHTLDGAALLMRVSNERRVAG